MIIKVIATFLVALFAFFGSANATVYTVKAGDTLMTIAGKHWKAVCKANRLANCNKIVVGQHLEMSSPVLSVKTSEQQGVFRWTRVGGAPLTNCGGKSESALNEEAWTKLALTGSEKEELRTLITSRGHTHTLIQPGERYQAVAFCKNGSVSFKRNVVTAWKKGSVVVLARTYVLSTGKKLHWVRNCNNWVLDNPVSVPAPVAVETPVEVPVAVSEPEPEQEIVPFHVTPAEEAGKSRCEAQAGTGVYANDVYRGKWLYGETICYVWENGQWQAGPGLYAMYGGGHSRTSAYRGQELGYGLQFGVQKNWINDRDHLSTFDLKVRLLRDKSWGNNPESGYRFTQKGNKLGLYAGYTERINKEGDLAGVVGEYWTGFGQSVNSTWSGQPVQNRGSVGVSGFYETKLSDDNKWRGRAIAGWALTNWDEQNWLKATYEVRYNKWLMFGPQLSVPLGVSHLNHPLSASQLTGIGAFVRVELGGKIREEDAKSRDQALTFIPAIANRPSE